MDEHKPCEEDVSKIQLWEQIAYPYVELGGIPEPDAAAAAIFLEL